MREVRGLGKEVQFEIGHQIEPTGSGEGGSRPDGRRESVSGRGHRTKAWRGKCAWQVPRAIRSPVRLEQHQYREGRKLSVCESGRGRVGCKISQGLVPEGFVFYSCGKEQFEAFEKSRISMLVRGLTPAPLGPENHQTGAASL